MSKQSKKSQRVWNVEREEREFTRKKGAKRAVNCRIICCCWLKMVGVVWFSRMVRTIIDENASEMKVGLLLMMVVLMMMTMMGRRNYWDLIKAAKKYIPCEHNLQIYMYICIDEYEFLLTALFRMISEEEPLFDHLLWKRGQMLLRWEFFLPLSL